jgi:hypothetical protein
VCARACARHIDIYTYIHKHIHIYIYIRRSIDLYTNQFLDTLSAHLGVDYSLRASLRFSLGTYRVPRHA